MSPTLHIVFSLFIGAAMLGAGVALPELVALRLIGLALLLSGYVGLLQNLGLDKPLNRLSGILAGFGAMGQVGWLLLSPAPPGFGMLYILSLLSAVMMTALALLHRPGAPQALGAVGAALTVGPILVIVLGHAVIGGFGVLSAGWWLSERDSDELVIWPAEIGIAALGFGATILIWRFGALIPASRGPSRADSGG